MERASLQHGMLLRGVQVLFLLILMTSLALVSSGCVSWNAADGTRHTLVLGVGLVSSKSLPDQSAAAFRCTTLGLAVQGGGPPGGLVLGYQSLQQTQIAPQWQGLVKVSAAPGQPLTVEGHGPELPAAVPATHISREEEMP